MSANKRSAVLTNLRPYLQQIIPPDGTVSALDRAHMAGQYPLEYQPIIYAHKRELHTIAAQEGHTVKRRQGYIVPEEQTVTPRH